MDFARRRQADPGPVAPPGAGGVGRRCGGRATTTTWRPPHGQPGRRTLLCNPGFSPGPSCVRRRSCASTSRPGGGGRLAGALGIPLHLEMHKMRTDVAWPSTTTLSTAPSGPTWRDPPVMDQSSASRWRAGPGERVRRSVNDPASARRAVEQMGEPTTPSWPVTASSSSVDRPGVHHGPWPSSNAASGLARPGGRQHGPVSAAGRLLESWRPATGSFIGFWEAAVRPSCGPIPVSSTDPVPGQCVDGHTPSVVADTDTGAGGLHDQRC